MMGESESMKVSRTLTIPSCIEEIRTIEELLSEFSEQQDLPPDALFQIQLSLEEIFTNVVNYAHDDGLEHEVEIILSKDGQTVTIEITDDGRPFDPLQDAPEMDAESPLDDRRVGGAGIALTKTMMTALRYHRDDGRNHLIMTKDI